MESPSLHFYQAPKDAAAVCALRAVLCLVALLCLTLYNPMDCSPPGSSVHGILHGGILEWVAMPSSRDLPNPGIEPRSPALQADSLQSEPSGKLTQWTLARMVFKQRINI